MRHPHLALLLVLALVLGACSGGGEAVDVEGGEDLADDGATGGAGQAASGGTLVAAIAGSPDQLDPHLTSAYFSFQILENVYDTLVEPDLELQMQPALAESWETSEDQLTWTFTLREGVTFHDGSELTADDVVYSMNRIKEEGANAFRLESVEEVTAVDDLTVEFALSRPTPNLLANVGAFKAMAILPDGAAEDLDLATEANGTGPFSLASYSEAEGAELEANPDYWGDGPTIEGVEFRFVSEPTAALTALQTGEIDWTDNIPPQQISTLEGEESVTVGSVPSNDYWYFAANQQREPFDDVRVRRALAFAIDREAVTQAAKFDAATVNQTAIPETSAWYYDYAPYEHDPEQAQQLLEEAGVSDLSVELMVTDEYPETIQAAQVIESQLSEIGVTAEIRTLDFASWLDAQGQGDFDVFLLGWLGNIDPDDFYYAQHHSTGGYNFHGYANEEVDRLLDEARQETDEDTRKDLYDEAVTLIVDEASYVFLYNPDVVHGWGPDVAGYEARPDRAIRFRDVELNR